ncbi:TetR/AcrR family transcriptional regulator [Deinococcus lacus]|uniref:TetR/AcrR family transcriptional regulator n=1 Tax=Deinococcus lacus TaxID=392561 RepID=A0ABW1YE09_9DEIO
MKVDRQEQDQARRERIARAAFELFARFGLEAISAQDIARAAFVSRTNLYRYYPSKLHMLLAHFERAVQETREEAVRRLRAGVPPQAIWQLVAGRMADLGTRYRHLVGAVGYAALGMRLAGGPPQGRGEVPPGVQTANSLARLVEPVLVAMRDRGMLREGVSLPLLSTLLVDSCLMALIHGEHRTQKELLADWQDRLGLVLGGVLVRGTPAPFGPA